MASRMKGMKIVDTLGERRLPHTSEREDPLRKDVPRRRRPGQKRGRTVGPCKEEHKYVMPWATLE